MKQINETEFSQVWGAYCQCFPSLKEDYKVTSGKQCKKWCCGKKLNSSNYQWEKNIDLAKMSGPPDLYSCDE